ncbi:MAG: helix-turn-helix transcriptional regulator [Flavobacteriaceae bacterium]|nr:helix-turn-helix transcriptional regulator [Flavobacteriaceae bacterium]
MNKQDKDRTNRIIQIYNDSRLTQKEFAHRIGVSQQLVSAVINYKKKPNQTILFGIIDNMDEIDPIWLLKGIGNYKNNYVAPYENSPLIVSHITNIVEKRFEVLSKELLQRVSSIEEKVRMSNALNILRRIDQDNSKLISEKNKSKGLGDKLRG